MINEFAQSQDQAPGVGEVEVAAACARLLTLLVAGQWAAGRQAAHTADPRQ